MLLDAIKKYEENDISRVIFKIEKDVFRAQNNLVYYVHNSIQDVERKKRAEKEYEHLRTVLKFIQFCLSQYDYVNEIPESIGSQLKFSRL